MEFITARIISLGSHQEDIPSTKHGKKVVLSRSYIKHPDLDKKNYGMGFISFGPKVNHAKIQTGANVGFRINTTKRGIKYLAVIRIINESDPIYAIVTVKSKSIIRDDDLFTTKNSSSFIISYAGWKTVGYETIFLIKPLDTIKINGSYYEFRDGNFKESKIQDSGKITEFITNKVHL